MVDFNQDKIVLAILKLGGKIFEKTMYAAFKKRDAKMIAAFVESENETFK